VTWVAQRLSDLARGAGRYTITIATALFDAVLSSVFVIFAMFLLLRDGKGVVEAIPDLLRFERNRSKALLGRIADAVYASVYGVVVIALLQGGRRQDARVARTRARRNQANGRTLVRVYAAITVSD
jgi:predicted PurR-regulated permease PerM